MPWCEECARYFTPNSVEEDGSCPTCGDTIQLPKDSDAPDDESSPWHFKLMVIAVTGYLGWRVIQLFV